MPLARSLDAGWCSRALLEERSRRLENPGEFVTPIACGGWLVAFERDHPARVVAYSMESGRPELTIPTPVDAQITCAAPGELLVGDRRLSLFRLPERRAIWTSKPMRAPITDIAATDTACAYRVRGSLDVVIVPRPSPSR